MRRISFAHTTSAFEKIEKDVTRRLGWTMAKPACCEGRP